MIKTLNLDSQTVEVNSSAGWLYIYREQFGRDILPDLMPVLESVLNAIASIIDESGGVFNDQTIAKAINNDALVDAFVKLAGMEVITILNILWAMAKNADDSIPSPVRFYNDFDKLPVDILVPALFNLVVDSSVSSKNARRLLQKIDEIKTAR